MRKLFLRFDKDHGMAFWQIEGNWVKESNLYYFVLLNSDKFPKYLFLVLR